MSGSRDSRRFGQGSLVFFEASPDLGVLFGTWRLRQKKDLPEELMDEAAAHYPTNRWLIKADWKAAMG